jgi:hypothetical protein
MDTNCFSPKPLRYAMQKAGKQGTQTLAAPSLASAAGWGDAAAAQPAYSIKTNAEPKQIVGGCSLLLR